MMGTLKCRLKCLWEYVVQNYFGVYMTNITDIHQVSLTPVVLKYALVTTLFSPLFPMHRPKGTKSRWVETGDGSMSCQLAKESHRCHDEMRKRLVLC